VDKSTGIHLEDVVTNANGHMERTYMTGLRRGRPKDDADQNRVSVAELRRLKVIQILDKPLASSRTRASSAGTRARLAFHCPGRPGRLSALSVFLCKSVFYGVFVWARRALNIQKLRFPARAVATPARVGFVSARCGGLLSHGRYCHQVLISTDTYDHSFY
jgi:hypothetical protein